MKNNLIILVSISIIIIGAIFLFFKQGNPETILPKRGHIVQAVYATGEVESVISSKISTQVSGKVMQVPVEEGDRVKTGQLLAQLDDGVEVAKISAYQAKLKYLTKEKDRYRELADMKYSSEGKYEKILSEYESIKAQLEAQQKLIERLKIVAPFDGVVLERNIESGETVTSVDIIFYVGDPDKLRVTAKVDEEDIPLVKIGHKVLIKSDSFPGKSFNGEVKEITPRGDPIDKNFRIRVSLPKGSPLLIGMTVEVNIITKEEQKALLVPTSSVVDGNIWLVNGNNIKKTKVITGISSEDFIQILNGLTDNQSIILNPDELK
jgi:RND family efflux transporter MFP subunit